MTKLRIPKFWQKKQNKRKKFLFFAVALIISLSSVGYIGAINGWFGGGSSVPEDTFSRGLVGYWSFDEGKGNVAYDASGNGNNGILTNGPEWTKGKNGGALQFDGKDDYAVTTNAVQAMGTGDFSVEGWILFKKTSAAGAFAGGGLMGTPTLSPGWHFGVDWGYLKFYTRDAGGTTATGKTQPFVVGKWYHLVGVRSGTSLKVYVDGQLFDSTTGDIRNVTNANNLEIGRVYGANGYSNCTIDDARIYNRALTDVEVKFHFSHGGPVGYWALDEGSGTSAKDSSGNNNDGAITGAGWTDGRHGSALIFDGTDRVSVPDSSTLDSAFGAENFTLEAWIYSVYKNDYQGIINKRQSAYYSASPGGLFVDNGGNTLRFLIGTGNENETHDGITMPLPHDEWIHVVGTANGSVMRLYKNGQFVGTANITKNPPANNDSLTIGAFYPGTRTFLGNIDDVKIYNYARTADEIRLDYQAGMAAHLGPSGKTCSEDPASCMDKGLVGYWDMDEGAGAVLKDKSGNGNNGALTNGPKWAKGEEGGALQFDGKDDYVNCGDKSIFDITGEITIEGWINVKGPTSTQQYIVEKGIINNTGYVVILGTSDRKLTFGIFNGPNAEDRKMVTSDVTVEYGKWSHFVATFVPSQYVSISINGVTKTASTVLAQMLSGTGYSLRIGQRSDYPNRAYFGVIDKLRIYNRALSAEEVRYHYNHGGPVGYWKFDEGYGMSAKDSSGDNNDGTITGASWTDGKYGSALSFDGSTSYVTAPAVINRTTMLNNGVTFSAWIKTAVSARQTIVANDSNTGCTYACMGGLEVDSSGKARMTVYNGSAYVYAESSTIVSDDDWHFVAGQYLNGGLKIYVDGNLEGEATPGGLYSPSIQYTNIGILRELTRDAYKFNGKIDDVKIYNYSRTAEQIWQDYNAGMAAHLGPSGKTCSEDPASCMDKGLVGYWSLDEGKGLISYDKSGNGNNGTLVSGPKWAAGKTGMGLQLDGKDDYLSIANNTSLNFSNAFTVEAWVNPYNKQSCAGGTYFFSIEKGGIGSGGSWGLWWHACESVWLYLRKPDNSNYEYVNSGSVSPRNKWHHIVAYFDGQNQLGKIYIDGIDKTNATNIDISSINQNSSNVTVGLSSPFRFNGVFDEVRLYNRILSPEEIRYHYNQGAPIAQWDMDEGTGSIINDSSGNHNRGTISGAAWVEGKYGSALSFDGNDSVNCGNSASLSPAKAITIESWVKPAIVDTNYRAIVGKWPIPLTGYLFFGQGTSAAANLHAEIGLSNGGKAINAGSVFTQDQWVHVSFVYDGSYLRLYKDGIEAAAPVAATGSITATSAPFSIGWYNSTGYWNGLIDEVKIYNYARTAEQIKTDYNAGVATHLK